MKKTLIIATAAGLALSSGIEETQDNELIMNSIKNGYYTATNAILSRPAMIAGGMQYLQGNMGGPTVFNLFDEADDEFMAKGHGHGQGHEGKQKGGKKKGKKLRPTHQPQPAPGQEAQPAPIQEAQPVDQAQDNNLAFEDDELVMNSIKNGYNTASNSLKNGYYRATNAVLSRPGMIAGGMQYLQGNMGGPTLLNLFDETADDEFMAKGHGQGHEGKQKGGKTGKKPRPQPQPVEQAQDNNLAFEDDNFAVEDFQDDELIMNSIKNGYYTATNAILSRPAMIAGGMQYLQGNMGGPTVFNLFDETADDELGALNVGVNGGNNGFGANAGYQGNIGRNGNWNVGGQVQTQPGGRPNWGVNAGVTIKFDEEDNELAAEKTEKPRRRRQPVERPDDHIKRNTKFRVPKEVAADNTLFDLAELLEDN